ncbi:hypothetical protein GQX73_g6775 [Xylaria multiplex]|uniref:C2H2-type domain-containing protein n=1 Tax=Xylaria multiplex TaxID=323545 RepID=A0A7C8N561_9PEZI|nr:hypothetical protein GQX73_g6775 [Xylaria multiplex]
MWSKVNILRKLYQEALKALKVFQRISGNHEKPPYYQDRGMLQNNTFRNSQSWLAELQDTAKIHELYDARQSSYVGNLEAYRHLSCNRASIPEADSHQLSPSEPSSASSGHSGSFPSDISPTSATLTSESPVLGHFPLPPGGVETNLQSFPTMGQVYQASRDREVPSPSVNTTRSIADMPSEWINMDRMLLNPEETLGSPTDINNLMLPDLLSIPSAQINEIPQLDTYTVNESFISPDNIHLQSSPSTSVPSYSNYELSPSSMSSGPELMRCTYPGCVFEPNGKPENRRAYMRKHLKSHQKIEIPCKVCGKTFTRQDNLTNHMHKKHTDVNESPSKRRRSLESLLSAGQPRRKESRRDVCGII